MEATSTVRKRARFQAVGYSADEMRFVGEQSLIASIKGRLARAEDVHDQPAPSLKRGYAIRKTKFLRARALRNWSLTGHTLANLRVLAARPNLVRVGFSTPEANIRAFFNNRRARQFGVSPRDRQNIARAFGQLRSPIQAKAA